MRRWTRLQVQSVFGYVEVERRLVHTVFTISMVAYAFATDPACGGVILLLVGTDRVKG
jgi:hypothetical protein